MKRTEGTLTVQRIMVNIKQADFISLFTF